VTPLEEVGPDASSALVNCDVLAKYAMLAWLHFETRRSFVNDGKFPA